MSDTMRSYVDADVRTNQPPMRMGFNIAPAVMIVDDDDLVRQHLKEIVTAAGYSARTAPTGIEALHSNVGIGAATIESLLKMASADLYADKAGRCSRVTSPLRVIGKVEPNRG